MSDQTQSAEIAPRPDPVVRAVTAQDIVEAMASGIRDFQAAPIYGLVFGGIYALGGILILGCAYGFGKTYLAYPLAAGFALIGPFAAVGLYEVSRRREAGLPLSFVAIFTVVFAQSKRELGWMAFVTLFVFLVWMYQARLLLALFLGFRSFTSLHEFVLVVTTTPEGLMFLLIGNLVGACMALLLFSLTVVSFPLLLDRDVDFVTAMITSFRAVMMSPLAMLSWGLIVVVDLAVAALPFFLGLLVVLPILGHGTWHLYRRLVVPAD
jgi:uncharacterized membrane protein